MSLLKSLLDSARKPELGHEIHDNCVILEVEAGGRRTKKENKEVNKNCFTKFAKLDEEGKITGEKEVSWFNLDHQQEYVKDNFVNQITQLVGILECYYTPEEVNDLLDPIFSDYEIKTEEDMEAIITDKDNSKNIIEDISKKYVESLSDLIGLDSTKLRIKLSFDTKGKYVQQPKFGIFTEPMTVEKTDSKLKFSKNEEENEIKSRNLISAKKPTSAAI